MSNYTPGPWRYEVDDHGRRIRGGSQFLTPIAFPADYNPGGLCPPYDIIDANMRMAAAAPEMAVVLRDVLEMIEQCGFGGSNARSEKRFEKRIRELLDKAAPPPHFLISAANSSHLPRTGGSRE